MKIYATYSDQGPLGIVGQTIENTIPRRYLYVISGDRKSCYDKLSELDADVKVMQRYRKRAILNDIFIDNPEDGDFAEREVIYVKCDEPCGDELMQGSRPLSRQL